MAGSAPYTDADVERALGRATAIIAGLDGVSVESRHGSTSYVLRGTSFAWLVADHHGDGRLAFWIRAPKDEQRALLAADPRRYFAPPYLGPRGWVGALAAPGDDPDWAEIEALIEQAWRMGATKRAVTELDARRAREG